MWVCVISVCDKREWWWTNKSEYLIWNQVWWFNWKSAKKEDKIVKRSSTRRLLVTSKLKKQMCPTWILEAFQGDFSFVGSRSENSGPLELWHQRTNVPSPEGWLNEKQKEKLTWVYWIAKQSISDKESHTRARAAKYLT